MRAGKVMADADVAEAHFHRAKGYSHEAVKIFMPAGAAEPVYAPYTEHYPPDERAARFWLMNRQRHLWTERREFTGKDGEPLFDRLMNMTDAQRIAEAALVLEQFKEQVRIAREAGEFDRLKTGVIDGEATEVVEEK